MVDPKLLLACKHIDTWCENHSVDYDLVCDESNIQGFMIFKKDNQIINGLMNSLSGVLESNNIHARLQKVRGGTIVALSLRALNENQFRAILDENGTSMSFRDRINNAFSQKLISQNIKQQPQQPPNSVTFDSTALRLVHESQRNMKDKGIRHKHSHSLNTMSKQKKVKKVNTEARLSAVFALPSSTHPVGIDHYISEALEGMATPSNVQPDDLFQKFAKSLSVLGQQMGIGPLQDKLKEQGINWKKSDDGQSIILFVQNAQTGAPQPIARISAATLEKPNEFERQLLAMIDFSRGEAPGAFEQQRDEIQAQEKAVRSIAKAVGGDEDPVGTAMTQPEQPVAPQAVPQAVPQAATQPKQPVSASVAQQTALK